MLFANIDKKQPFVNFPPLIDLFKIKINQP